MRVRYLRDTKKFWEERKAARAALDTRRSLAPASEKVSIFAKMHEDAKFLRRGHKVK